MAASALGSLIVKLALDYAQYTQGLDKSSQEALKFGKNVQDNFDKAAKSASNFLGGLAAGAVAAVASYQTVKAVVDGFTASVNRLDEISKTSARLGIPAEELQKLAFAGDLADVSLQSLGTGVKKLSTFMVEAAGGGKEQVAIFKALGVEYKNTDGTLRATSDVMADLADQFQDLEDGPVKTALAVKVFGKAGQELISLLNGGRSAFKEAGDEAQKFGLVIGGDTLKNAEHFNDNITRMGAITKGTFNAISQGVLPVLNDLGDAYIKAASDTNSLNQQTQRLARDGSLRSWAEDVVDSITYIIDVGQRVGQVFSAGFTIVVESVKTAVFAMSGLAQGAAAALRGDWAGVTAAFVTVKDQVKSSGTAIADSFRVFADGSKTLGERIREQMSASRAARAETAAFANETNKLGRQQDTASGKAEKLKAITAALGDSHKAGAAKVDEAAKAFNAFNDEMNKHEAEIEQVYKVNEKLTVSEKLLAEVMTQSSERARKLTPELRNIVVARLQGLVVADKEAEQFKKDQQVIEAGRQANEDFINSVRQKIAATEEDIKQAKIQGQEIGNTKYVVELLAISRLRDAAAQQEQLAAGAEQLPQGERLAEMYRKQAAALRELANIRDANNDKQKAVDDLEAQRTAAKDLTDDIGRWLSDAIVSNGRSAWDAIRDYVKNRFLQPILQPVAGALGNIAGSFFGGGASTGGALSGASNGLQLVSSIKSLYDAVQTGFASVGGTVTNAFNSFAASSYGQSLGLSTPVADTLGYVYNAPTPAASAFGSGVGSAVSIGAGAIAGVYGGRAISGGYSAFGGSGNSTVNAGTAIGAVVGTIVPVIGTAIGAAVGGIIGGVVNRVFGRKAPEVESRFLEGTFSGGGSFSGSNVTNIVEKGGLLRSDKRYSQTEAVTGDLDKALDEGGKKIAELAQKYGDALGLPVGQLRDVSTAIKVEVTDNLEDNTKKIQSALQEYADALFGAFTDELEPLRKAGETISQTIERVGGTLLGVNAALDQIGQAALSTSVKGGEAAVALADLFGGLDNFQQATSSFYQNFFDEQERTEQAMTKLGEVFAQLGVETPKTRDAFRDLVQSQDLTTESGRETFAALLAVSGAFAELVPPARSAADILKERQGLEEQLLQVQGDTVELRRREREALDESNRALYDQIKAQEDAKDAAEAAAEATRKAAEASRALNQAIDSNIGKFLSPQDNIQYQAERVSSNLAAVGGTVTADELLGMTKQQIFDLTVAFVKMGGVSDEVKTVVVEAAGAMADLIDEAEALARQTAINDVQSQIDDLTATYGDLSSVVDDSESIVDAWRRSTTELENLQDGLDRVLGTSAKTVQEVLADLLRQRQGIQSLRQSVQSQIEDTRLRTLSPEQRVAALRQQQENLFRELSTTDDISGVANKLSGVITKLAQEEAKVRESALKKEIGLTEEAARKQQDSIKAQIDGYEKLKSMGQDLRQFTAELRFGDLSPKSFDNQFAAARNLFEDTLAKAKGGDAFALSNLQSNARAFLEEAASYSPVGTAMYADIFNEVTNALDELSATNVDPQLEALRALLVDSTDTQAQELAVATSQLEAQERLDAALAVREAQLQEKIDAQTKAALDQIAATKQITEALGVQVQTGAEQFVVLRDQLEELNAQTSQIVSFYQNEQGATP